MLSKSINKHGRGEVPRPLPSCLVLVLPLWAHVTSPQATPAHSVTAVTLSSLSAPARSSPGAHGLRTWLTAFFVYASIIGRSLHRLSHWGQGPFLPARGCTTVPHAVPSTEKALGGPVPNPPMRGGGPGPAPTPEPPPGLGGRPHRAGCRQSGGRASREPVSEQEDKRETPQTPQTQAKGTTSPGRGARPREAATVF